MKSPWIDTSNAYPGDRHIGTYLLTKRTNKGKVKAFLWEGVERAYGIERFWKPAPAGYCPYCQRGMEDN